MTIIKQQQIIIKLTTVKKEQIGRKDNNIGNWIRYCKNYIKKGNKNFIHLFVQQPIRPYFFKYMNPIQQQHQSFLFTSVYQLGVIQPRFNHHIYYNNKTIKDILCDTASEPDSQFKFQPTIYSKVNESITQIKRPFSTKTTFSSSIKQKIQNSKQIKQRLCCRQYFQQNEQITKPQDMRTEYKNFHYPFNSFNKETIKKTICAFLNAQGGIIYIGIQQNIYSKKRIVLGRLYTQLDRENILRVIREIAQNIMPQIISNQGFKVQFVPVRKCNTQQYIPGCFVIKIIVKFGQRDQLYTYKNDKNEDQYALKTENEVLQRDCKDIRKLLSLHREKILHPLQEPEEIHSGKCLKPYSGAIIYSKK